MVIRLLDPPLHEFLPAHDDLVSGLADLKVQLTRCNALAEIDKLLKCIQSEQKILNRVESLREANPMLGLRGDRLGIMMPDVSEMQVRAIFRAAARVQHEGGVVKAKIMIPLAGHVNELTVMRELVERVAEEVFEELHTTVKFDYGTMVEVPRAALTADEMAREAEFFSFGTNDLTQTTFGMSRDDAEAKFLSHYVKEGILRSNPFQTAGRGGCREADRDGGEARAKHEAGPASGDLRGAWRGPEEHCVLPPNWVGLRELRGVQSTGCASSGGAGCAFHQETGKSRAVGREGKAL